MVSYEYTVYMVYVMHVRILTMTGRYVQMCFSWCVSQKWHQLRPNFWVTADIQVFHGYRTIWEVVGVERQRPEHMSPPRERGTYRLSTLIRGYLSLKPGSSSWFFSFTQGGRPLQDVSSCWIETQNSTHNKRDAGSALIALQVLVAVTMAKHSSTIAPCYSVDIRLRLVTKLIPNWDCRSLSTKYRIAPVVRDSWAQG